MLVSICQSLVDIDRRANTFVSSTAVASSITSIATPKINACVILKFSTAQTGTITINGTLDGSSTNETITVSSSKIAVGIKLFSTTTSISLDSNIVSAGGTVECKFTGQDGGSIFTTVRVVSGFPARISRNNANLAVPNSGTVQVEKTKALLPYTETFEPKDGDIISLIETSNRFMVVGSPLIEMVGFNMHYVCTIERYEE